MSSPRDVLELAKKHQARMADIKFTDTFGTWQHFSVPIGEITEEVFTEGMGFDGSSIRGWKSIEASDMLALPDPTTAFLDPFCAVPTLSLTCTIAETGTKEPYGRDPRGIAQRAVRRPPTSATRSATRKAISRSRPPTPSRTCAPRCCSPSNPSANPYLAFAALLLAGLDGILNKIEPGEPMDKNLSELPPDELTKVPQICGSLSEALDCLKRDHEFFLYYDV